MDEGVAIRNLSYSFKPVKTGLYILGYKQCPSKISLLGTIRESGLRPQLFKIYQLYTTYFKLNS